MYKSFYENSKQVLKWNLPVWEHETKKFYVFVAKDKNLYYWNIGTKKDFDQDNKTSLAWTTPLKRETKSPCPNSLNYTWKVRTLESNSSSKAASKSELQIDSVGKRYKTGALILCSAKVG